MLRIYSSYFVKRSPLRDLYDKFLFSAMASGLNLKWERDVINSYGVERHGVSNKTITLSLSNLQFPFFALLFGAITSTAVLIGEFMFHSYYI